MILQHFRIATFDTISNILIKISAITDIYNQLNIREITESFIDEFYQLALDVHEEIDLTGEIKTELLHLANLIMNRDH